MVTCDGCLHKVPESYLAIDDPELAICRKCQPRPKCYECGEKVVSGVSARCPDCQAARCRGCNDHDATGPLCTYCKGMLSSF